MAIRATRNKIVPAMMIRIVVPKGDQMLVSVAFKEYSTYELELLGSELFRCDSSSIPVVRSK